jgi:hypothetical protein
MIEAAHSPMELMRFLSRFTFFLVLAFPATMAANGQTAPSARERTFNIYVGGMGSIFQPQYPGQHLDGAGIYSDIALRRWLQIEAEARWLRFNEPQGASQDHYGIGPKIPFYRVGRIEAYGKFLFTDTKITFGNHAGYGHFLDYTLGGGADVRLSRHWVLRAIDGEYHYVTGYFGDHITPYGYSMGLAYKVY